MQNIFENKERAKLPSQNGSGHARDSLSRDQQVACMPRHRHHISWEVLGRVLERILGRVLQRVLGMCWGGSGESDAVGWRRRRGADTKRVSDRSTDP